MKLSKCCKYHLYLHSRKIVYRKLFRPLLDFFLSIVTLCMLIPLILFISLLFKLSRKPKHIIFFVALEHIINKTIDRGNWFENKYYECYYFSYEQTKVDGKTNVGEKLIKIHSYFFINIIIFFYKLMIYYPSYIEVYLASDRRNLLNQVYFLSIARLFGIFSTLVLRGETHPDGNYFKRSNLWRFNLEICLSLCQKILYRELKNTIDFKRYPNKSIFDYNCIPINEFSGKKYNKTILFLNGFKYFRRVEILAKSVRYVVNFHPEVHFIFAGARSEKEKEIVFNELKQDNMLQYSEVHGWIKNPKPLYEKSSIFVLPADENLIFCNYSLLEAMERGLVPILSDVSDARKFVINNHNGLLVNQDPKELAEAIIFLLNNPEIMKKMGTLARQKIISNFDNENRMRNLWQLIEFYQKV